MLLLLKDSWAWDAADDIPVWFDLKVLAKPVRNTL